jgi:hypothetical protein
VFVEPGEDGKTYTIIREEFMESVVLEDEIWQRQIRYFERKLKIPIHHFWHPEAAEQEAEAKVKSEADAEVRAEVKVKPTKDR